MTRPCQHLRTGIFRRPHAAGEHLVELCTLCGVNVRGAGTWVKRGEVRDPSALPLVPAPQSQPTLFDLGGRDDA